MVLMALFGPLVWASHSAKRASACAKGHNGVNAFPPFSQVFLVCVMRCGLLPREVHDLQWEHAISKELDCLVRLVEVEWAPLGITRVGAWQGRPCPHQACLAKICLQKIVCRKQIYWACGEKRAALKDADLSEIYALPVKTVIRGPSVFRARLSEEISHRETGGQRVRQALGEQRPANFWHDPRTLGSHGVRGPNRP